MDDFPTSPSKRRRTESPELPHAILDPVPAEPTAAASNDSTDQDLNRDEGGTDGILDALMQHVESEYRGPEVPEYIPSKDAVLDRVRHAGKSISQPEVPQPEPSQLEAPQPEPMQPEVSQPEPSQSEAPQPEVSQTEVSQPEESLPAKDPMQADADVDVVMSEPALSDGQGLAPADPPMETQLNGSSNQEAEWEADSSPYDSSTDTSTDTDSSDESDDADGEAGDDYDLLDAEAQVRILMQDDGGSDEDGDKPNRKSGPSRLRTTNEKDEEVIPIPQVDITNAQIEELGAVEGVVENTVLIKAKISGEYRVLEVGSLLCSKDKTVIGVVAETLGRVQQPMYTIQFTNYESIESAGLSEKGTMICFVPQHSTFVFTQPLKAFKGSDASNFHDEEVGDEEMEFSDDEAEAEHKRKLKNMKRKGMPDDGDYRGRGRGRGSRGGQARGVRTPYQQSHTHAHDGDSTNGAYGAGSLEMNYDDGGGADEGYTPLTRPTNYQEMISSTPPQPGLPNSPLYSISASGTEGDQRGGHRGNYQGRGGRGAGGRGRGRGNFGRSPRGHDRQHHNQNSPLREQHNFQHSYNNQYGQPSATPTSMLPPGPPSPYSHASAQWAHGHPAYSSFPPQAPSLTPYQSSPNSPFSPSPISPLPRQHFDSNPFSSQMGSQPYLPQQPPTSNGAMMPPPPPGWQGNHAAAAEVQRMLEQMRANQQR